MALSNIVYKDFTFPHNPRTSGCKCDRSYIKHKYPELAGSELEDFGPNAIVITGSGEFFGDDAYGTWNRLYDQFASNGVGNVSHPIYKHITRGLMTSLSSTLESIENYISYEFEIVADTDIQINECIGNYVVVNTQTAQPQEQNTNSIVHTVIKGECLSVICANYSKKYGVKIKWKNIAKLNNMANPDLIYPGDKITIQW